MINFLNLIDGYKTYIVAAAGIIINGLQAVAPQLALPISEINTVLAFLGLGALRSGVTKTPVAK